MANFFPYSFSTFAPSFTPNSTSECVLPRSRSLVTDTYVQIASNVQVKTTRDISGQKLSLKIILENIQQNQTIKIPLNIGFPTAETAFGKVSMGFYEALSIKGWYMYSIATLTKENGTLTVTVKVPQVLDGQSSILPATNRVHFSVEFLLDATDDLFDPRDQAGPAPCSFY